VNDKEFLGCAVIALLLLAPLILLIIGVVQLRKLKAAVKNLVQRVAELESHPSSAKAAAPEPAVASAAPLVPAPL